jgi:hypothetical protein
MKLAAIGVVASAMSLALPSKSNSTSSPTVARGADTTWFAPDVTRAT